MMLTARSRRLDAAIAIALFLSVFLLRLLQLDSFPPAAPTIPDEFSYLFAADTFAAGRLTNPPHPLQPFFETRHILSFPTVMSKYQPGTALFFLAGKTLLGDYHWGMAAAVALLVAVSYWALLAWSGRAIALALCLAMIALLRAPHYWIYSYWGGAHAMTACMLMLGAYPRIFYHKKTIYIWFALAGLILGLLTRPFETVLLAALLLAGGVAYMLRFMAAAARKRLLMQLCLPTALVLAFYLAAQGYYNHAVTHNMTTLPYTAYQQQYGVVPHWITGNVHMERLSHNPLIATWQKAELKTSEHTGASKNWLLRHPATIAEMLGLPRSFTHPAFLTAYGAAIAIYHLFMPLIFAYIAFIRRRYYLLVAGLAATTIAYTLMTVMFPHYLVAYFAVQMAALAVLGKEFLVSSLSRACKAIGIGALLLPACLLLASPVAPSPSNQARAGIASTLLQKGGQHLIFIDHLPEIKERAVDAIWVFNAPDIDAAPVVWARYISPVENKKLLDYYPNRKAWYYEPYRQKKLLPYKE
jgi:hypothetical protein